MMQDLFHQLSGSQVLMGFNHAAIAIAISIATRLWLANGLEAACVHALMICNLMHGNTPQSCPYFANHTEAIAMAIALALALAIGTATTIPISVLMRFAFKALPFTGG